MAIVRPDPLLNLVAPPVALDAERRLGPFRTEALDGLEHASPSILQQIVAIQHHGDRDTLAGGQRPKGPSVVCDHADLAEDLRFCGVHGVDLAVAATSMVKSRDD